MIPAHLKKLAVAIAKGVSDQELEDISKSVSTSEIEKEISLLSENRAALVELLGVLFPKGIPLAADFYHKLSKLQIIPDIKKAGNSLAGLAWSEANMRLAKKDAEKLLKLLAEDESINFWFFVFQLPTFLSQTELPSEFAASWFADLNDKIGEDLAGGNFFKAVENYGINFSDSGISILENYLSAKLNEKKIHLASTLLGAVRSSSKKDDLVEEKIESLDDTIKNSPYIELRKCFYRSWVIPFWKKVLSIEQLDSLLKKMMQGNEVEISEAFFVLYRCLVGRSDCKNFADFAMEWLKENVSPQLPSLAKYYILNSITYLSDNVDLEGLGQKKQDVDQIILGLQPIPDTEQGIWEELEYYMVKRLKEDYRLFQDLFVQMSLRDPIGLIAQFKEDKFAYLKTEMMKTEKSQLVTKLIFSKNSDERRLGFILFNKIRIDNLDEKILTNISETRLRITLLEFVRRPFLGEDTSRFFITLEPFFQSASKEIKDEFMHEMIRQAINYPGSCLDNWKKIPKKSQLLSAVIKSAEEYFENISKVAKSPANSFAFPGFINAVQKMHKEFSRKVSDEAHEKSIISKLAKKVNIIYGSQWCMIIEGEITEPSSFKEYSHSIEVPRLELIDPEGETRIRMWASSEITKLEIEKEDK